MVINLLFHRPLLESFLFALALAVGLTPELLPMIVSVTLARGALRMAKERVIVKRLAAIHDLGSMDVLCTDKTGTLTEAKIRLIRQIAISGADSPHVLELAWLNSHFETGIRSPLDAAIIEHGEVDGAGWAKLDEVPFDFERRRVSVLVEKDGRRLLVVKGAPEDVLRLSSHYDVPGAGNAPRSRPGGPCPGGSAFRRLWGRRAFAPSASPSAMWGRITPMPWWGMSRIWSSPASWPSSTRPSRAVGAAIEALGRSGIRVKILTGDNERVTHHLCGALGIPVAGVLTGTEMAALSEEALSARIEEINLFCRVTPAAEEPHHPGPEAPRPCGRLHGRRHQ